MSDLGDQVAVVGLILATLFAGPGVAIGLLQHRTRRERTRRRSPLPDGFYLLREPGHSLREQLDELQTDVMLDVILLSTMPLALLAVWLTQAHLRGLDSMWRLAWIFGITTIGFVAYAIWRLLRRAAQMDKLRTGLDAEQAVGQELNHLMRQGAAVFHDVPAESFNVDHVVVSVHGVYALETKGYTKPQALKGREGATVRFDGNTLQFPAWKTSAPLEQSERQADWLAKWLTSATAVSVQVFPVVALPGWFVERNGRGSVRVVSGREVRNLFGTNPQSRLNPETVQRVLHQLEQRCKTVAPRYRGKDGD